MHITLDMAVDATRKAVAQKGADHVVDYCRYYVESTGKGSCIVGTALEILGVDLVKVFEGVNGETFTDKYLIHHGITLDEGAMLFFREAQWEQDSMETWGFALACAEARMQWMQ